MSNKLVHNGWRITHLPKVYPAAAYDRAREEVIAKVTKNADVVAVMDFGWEQFPGISDIDFYIVFAQDAKTMFIPQGEEYTPETSYLLMHTVLLISEEFLKELRYLNPWSVHAKERYLYKRTGFVEPTIKELPTVDPVLSAAFMYDKIESILSTLPLYVQKILPVRNLFELCKNCVYNIWRLDDLGIAPVERYDRFVKEFDALREKWFSLLQSEALDRLIKVYEQTLTYTFEIAWMLDAWIAERVTRVPPSDIGLRKTRWPLSTAWENGSNALYIHTYKYARLFTDKKVTPREAMLMSAVASGDIKLRLGPIRKTVALTPIILPWNLSALATTTIAKGGILGTALRKDTLTNANSVPILQVSSLDYRIDRQNELTDMYRAKRIPAGEGKGYIYGNQLYGYLFGEENVMRKFLVAYMRFRFFRNLDRVLSRKA